MIYCHNCQQITPMTQNGIACGACRCEAVEIIRNERPTILGNINFSTSFRPPMPVYNGVFENFVNLNNFESMVNRMSSLNFSNFPMMETRMILRPHYTTVLIIEGDNVEEDNQRVDQQKMKAFAKIGSLSQDCSICQQNNGNGIKLTCGHQFHEQCITPWFKNKNSCPCCRQKF